MPTLRGNFKVRTGYICYSLLIADHTQSRIPVMKYFSQSINQRVVLEDKIIRWYFRTENGGMVIYPFQPNLQRIYREYEIRITRNDI